MRLSGEEVSLACVETLESAKLFFGRQRKISGKGFDVVVYEMTNQEDGQEVISWMEEISREGAELVLLAPEKSVEVRFVHHVIGTAEMPLSEQLAKLASIITGGH